MTSTDDQRRVDWHNRAVEAEADLERLRAERQAILDCINLYGDETLHGALDAAGLLPRKRVAPFSVDS